ncbi:MAG: peptidylprolyl isomerase [Candidatus Competibacteraceae bacterium]|nr:MAG: peptidylprolyl isomerase [Candidatus Competibacteraceae bacterium]
MLQFIRERARGWVAYTIVGFLTVPFALWGIHSYFEGGAPSEIAEVGKAKISLQEFQRAYQNQRQRLQALMGDDFDPEFLEGTRLRQEVLQQLIDEQVLNRAAREQGFRVSDRQLFEAVRALPVFQESGGFDGELYERLLRHQGMTPSMFEEGLRQSLATEQLRTGVIVSALFTPAEQAQLIALLRQQRELHYTVLPLENYQAAVQMDDAAIQDYFANNPTRFVNPEQVQVQFIELHLERIAEELTVGEEELQAAYQDQAARYSQPEQRSASHILVQLPPSASAAEVETARARAQALAERIHSGEQSFEEALREAQADPAGGVEGGELGVISQGLFDSPAFEIALYALEEPGAVSEPVRMPSGFHLIRLDQITPAQVQPFAEARAAVAAELRQQKAENHFYDIIQTLANLSFEHPDTLEPAARALGVTIQDSDWFGRTGDEGIFAHPRVLASVFSDDVLRRRINSEPIELEPGRVVVLRVREHQPAAPLTLEEAREDIVATLREQQAREALSRDIETVRTRVAQGEHLQTLATEFGGEFRDAGLVGRDALAVDRTVLDAAFRLPQPEAGQMALGSVILTNGDRAVLGVTQVVPGRLDAFSEEERQILTRQLAQQMGVEQFDSLLASLRQNTKIVTYPNRM